MTESEEPLLVPARISALNALADCPGFAALDTLDDRPSTAADTGTALGYLIELFHRGYMFEDSCRKLLEEAPEKCPLMDFEQARDLVLSYCADPRNHAGKGSPRGDVLPDSGEQEVYLELPCDEDDPTGRPIRMTGHVDQIREYRSQLYVWDVKGGKGGGKQMTYDYLWQLCGYALAATQTLGRPVLLGGIIRVRGYKTRKPVAPADADVFWPIPISLDRCREILSSAVYLIGQLRQGKVLTQPGMQCMWCPGGSPWNCGDEIEEHKGRLMAPKPPEEDAKGSK